MGPLAQFGRARGCDDPYQGPPRCSVPPTPNDNTRGSILRAVGSSPTWPTARKSADSAMTLHRGEHPLGKPRGWERLCSRAIAICDGRGRERTRCKHDPQSLLTSSICSVPWGSQANHVSLWSWRPRFKSERDNWEAKKRNRRDCSTIHSQNGLPVLPVARMLHTGGRIELLSSGRVKSHTMAAECDDVPPVRGLLLRGSWSLPDPVPLRAHSSARTEHEASNLDAEGSNPSVLTYSRHGIHRRRVE